MVNRASSFNQNIKNSLLEIKNKNKDVDSLINHLTNNISDLERVRANLSDIDKEFKKKYDEEIFRIKSESNFIVKDLIKDIYFKNKISLEEEEKIKIDRLVSTINSEDLAIPISDLFSTKLQFMLSSQNDIITLKDLLLFLDNYKISNLKKIKGMTSKLIQELIDVLTKKKYIIINEDTIFFNRLYTK